RETIKNFRLAKVNVLIATAVIEEGLDIPQCDLVIRFNKPNNFSSYMQSKGRARAKQNASYILFMDASNIDAYNRDQIEYQNYEEIEKMIQHGFSLDEYDDDSNIDLSEIPPYCPSNGLIIDATRAAQLIMEYCVLLGNGQIFPPRFLFHGHTNPYTCILSMPANCPVRDDIQCTSKRKKLAKYKCCLEITDSESQPVYYPIEFLCYAPLNKVDLEIIYKLPSILVRISQLYRIERLRKLFADNIKYYSLLDSDQMPTVTFNDCLRTNTNPSLLPLIPLIYNNLSLNLSKLQPSPDILFQAITRRSTDEKTDMENLEILGDCFLKLTVSMALYHRHPLASAGALTVEKAKQISNENLYRIAVQKQLKCYLNVMKINFRGKDANWLPPGYIINEIEQMKNNYEFNIKRYNNQYVKRKAFADMIEAFIGAFLISTNYIITIEFMKWLGLDVIPLNDNNNIMEIPSILCPCNKNNEINQIVEKFYIEQEFFDIENVIKYKFNNKAYLIAAFTHPSSFTNRLTNCYERLEFLGDAVLDFLVTRHIFANNTNITPALIQH
ncbi:unnamed protein product, partial [Rotaria sp. Silwood1]